MKYNQAELLNSSMDEIASKGGLKCWEVAVTALKPFIDSLGLFPKPRAANIKNPIEKLTQAEKDRLAHLIMWVLDGPEQGFCTSDDVRAYKKELRLFLNDNNIYAGGMWSMDEK